MTEEEILRLVAEGNLNALAEQVAGLDEKGRKKLKAPVVKLHRTIMKETASNRIHKVFVGDYAWLAEFLPESTWDRGEIPCASYLAMLAVGGLTEAKRVAMDHIGVDDNGESPVFKVLEDRRPDWADAWLEHHLRRPFDASWQFVEPLIQRGVFKRPTSDGYYTLMATGFMPKGCFPAGDPRNDGYLISDFLRENPVMLEGVWRLFRIYVFGFLTSKDQWEVQYDREPWALALERLSEEGLLDRGRLLTESLTNLPNDFDRDRSIGLMDFYQGMKPTVEEGATCQPLLRDLLAAPRDTVAVFAQARLQELSRAGALDDEAYVSAVGVVFDKEAAGLAKKAVTTLKQIEKRSPTLRPRIIDALIRDGLRHAKRDIQEAVLGVLEAWDEDLGPESRERIGEMAPELPRLLRPAAAALANGGDGDPAPKNPARPKVAAKGKGAGGPAKEAQPNRWVAPQALEERIAGLSAHWRKRAGVDASAAALQEGQWPPALEWDPLSVPVLNGRVPVNPVADLEDLLATIAAAVEQLDDGMVLERILDGISRFCDQGLEAPRVDPIVHRIKKTKRSKHPASLASTVLCGISVRDVLLDWLAPTRKQKKKKGKKPSIFSGATVEAFLGQRIMEVQGRIQRRLAVPLLCLPTHVGGWLQPGVLLDRLRIYEERGIDVPKHDFIQALLRLTPEGRDEALESSSCLTSEGARALQWALGGSESTISNRDDPDVWLAATRARDPLGRVSLLGHPSEMERPFVGPDAVEAMAYEWELLSTEELQETVRKPSRKEMDAQIRAIMSADVDDLKDGSSTPHRSLYGCMLLQKGDHYVLKAEGIRPAQLTTQLHQTVHTFEGVGSWILSWLPLAWPQQRTAFFAEGLASVLPRVRNGVVEDCWNCAAYLAPLHEPDEPITETARLLLWAGCLSSDVDTRAMAHDVLATSIDDGRFHVATMSEALGVIMTAPWMKWNRLADTIGTVSEYGPLHATMAVDVFARVLGAQDAFPRDVAKCLEVALVALEQNELALSADFCETLTRFKGSGKAAKLAKKLLALEANKSGAMQEVRQMLLEARIARAERWARAEPEV